MNSSTSSSKPLARFLLRIALPFLGFIALLCFLLDGWFTRTIVLSVGPEGATKVQRMFTVNDPEEMPVFGNSRINNGFHPDSISPHFWNYGLNGAAYPTVEMLFRKEMSKPHTTPVVLGIDINFFMNELGNPNYLIPNYRDFKEVRELMNAEGSGHLYYYLPLLRYYGTFEWYCQRYLSMRNPEYTGCDYIRGANICDRPFNEEARRRAIAAGKVEFHLDTNFLNRFVSIVRSREDRKIVLVSMPYHREYYQYFTLDQDWHDCVDRLKKLPNVVWIEFSGKELPHEFFVDMTHLNGTGAKWFSGELRKRMIAAGVNIP